MAVKLLLDECSLHFPSLSTLKLNTISRFFLYFYSPTYDGDKRTPDLSKYVSTTEAELVAEHALELNQSGPLPCIVINPVSCIYISNMKLNILPWLLKGYNRDAYSAEQDQNVELFSFHETLLLCWYDQLVLFYFLVEIHSIL